MEHNYPFIHYIPAVKVTIVNPHDTKLPSKQSKKFSLKGGTADFR